MAMRLVFSRYYLGMVETGPFFGRGRTVDWGGGGLAVLGRQTP